MFATICFYFLLTINRTTSSKTKVNFLCTDSLVIHFGNAPISPRIVFFQSARSGPDCPRSIIFWSARLSSCIASNRPPPLFFNQIEPRSMDHSWGTILGRSSRDRHVSGAKVCAGIRQRPDKGPIETRFSHARKWTIPARERTLFAAVWPIYAVLQPFFVREWPRVCVWWRRWSKVNVI